MITQEAVCDVKKNLTPPSKDFTYEILEEKGYELVLKVENKKTGLKAVIAVHNLSLGPALGGTRIFPYNSFDEATEDALRLAKGMTYKSAIAECGTGGGKSVIMASQNGKTEPLLRSFGEVVESLKGNYICAEDLNCTTDDVKVFRKATKYVVGLSHEKSSGNPALFTAWGTFRGIQAVAKKLYGKDSLQGVKIALQGLGSVGMPLAEHLFWAGADLIISDIRDEKAKTFARKFGAEVVSNEKILSTKCDILAPCALGAVINDETVPLLQCKGIAGCANNQLLRDDHADALRLRDILYAPDYVLNAGGLINVVAEIREEGYDSREPRKKTHDIYDTLLGIFEISEKNHMSTLAATNALAEYRIQYGIGKRVTNPVFHHSAD